jgi:TRAP-type C4-dicarboxylate transport system permease small subunit
VSSSETFVAAKPWYQRLAAAISIYSMGLVFALFIFGIGMRYIFNHPISWVDEVVTVLSVWSVFWTAAFVLRWPDHISFDIIYVNQNPARQRLMLLVVNLAFAAFMLAALPGMIDYTLFLWREKTDMLEMRLDFVYAIFPIFLMAIVVRQMFSIKALLSKHWRSEVKRWNDLPEEDSQ